MRWQVQDAKQRFSELMWYAFIDKPYVTALFVAALVSLYVLHRRLLGPAARSASGLAGPGRLRVIRLDAAKRPPSDHAGRDRDRDVRALLDRCRADALRPGGRRAHPLRDPRRRVES